MNNTPPFDNDYEKRVQQAYASIGIKQPARMAAGGVVEDTGGMLSAAARGIKPKLSAEDEAYFNAHNQYATDFTAYSDAYNKWADDWNAGRTEAAYSGIAEPTAPTVPTAQGDLDINAYQAQLAAAAQGKASSKVGGIRAFANPEAYNLSGRAGLSSFKNGGEAKDMTQTSPKEGGLSYRDYPSEYGSRAYVKKDGSYGGEMLPKYIGWAGLQEGKGKLKGSMVTEYSMEDEKGSFPTINPLLSMEEINLVASGIVTPTIYKKSVKWRDMQNEKGESAFLNPPGFENGGEAVAAQDPRAMDLEQFLLDNSRMQAGPVDVQEVRSSKGPGKYDTRISRNEDGFQAFADVDVGDKKLSQVGASFVGRGRIGNYEVQYVFDPETKQPVITGAIRKELSPTSDVSAEGVYVPQKDGKDYYNAGVRYTKRFEDGGEVTNENDRTLRSIDVTPTNKKEVGHPNEYVDAVARWGRKGQEGFANMIGLGEEVKFANAIPEFYFPKDEQLDGRGDAMRHMLLQAQIAKKYGRTPAEIASYIHENWLTGGQSDAEKAMDVSNDARGMDIGLRSKDKADMAYQALQAIKSGEAKTIAKKTTK